MACSAEAGSGGHFASPDCADWLRCSPSAGLVEKVGAWAELLPSEGVAASGRLHGGAERHVPPAGLSLVAGAETQHKLSPLTWVCVCGGGGGGSVAFGELSGRKVACFGCSEAMCEWSRDQPSSAGQGWGSSRWCPKAQFAPLQSLTFPPSSWRPLLVNPSWDLLKAIYPWVSGLFWGNSGLPRSPALPADKDMKSGRYVLPENLPRRGLLHSKRGPYCLASDFESTDFSPLVLPGTQRGVGRNRTVFLSHPPTTLTP